MRNTRKYYGVLKYFIFIPLLLVLIAVLCLFAGYLYANSFVNTVPADDGSTTTELLNSLKQGKDVTAFKKTEGEIASVINAHNELYDHLGFLEIRDLEKNDAVSILNDAAFVNKNFGGENLTDILLFCTDNSDTKLMMTVLLSIDTEGHELILTTFPSYILVYDEELGPVRIGEVFLHSGLEGVRKALSYVLSADIEHYMETRVSSASDLLLMLDEELGYELIMEKSGFKFKASDKDISLMTLEEALRDTVSQTRADFTLKEYLTLIKEVKPALGGKMRLVQPSAVAGTECVVIDGKMSVKTNFIAIKDILSK